MKKFLLMLLMTLTLSATAFSQTQWYRTSEIAMRYKQNGYWTDWTDWERCVVNVSFDLVNDVITIYSAKTQRYKVIRTETPPYDSGGKQVKFYICDQDGDYGHIRLRIENSGNSQIYVDFADVSWVYNVRRTS